MTESYVPVKDNIALVRDEVSLAILNKDINDLQTYRQHRERILKERNEIEVLRAAQSQLSQELSEIKALLLTIVQQNKGTN